MKTKLVIAAALIAFCASPAWGAAAEPENVNPHLFDDQNANNISDTAENNSADALSNAPVEGAPADTRDVGPNVADDSPWTAEELAAMGGQP